MVLHAYGGAPASLDEVADDWPHELSIEHATDARTLLFFVHPRCPCTSASIDELASLLQSLREEHRPEVRVVVRMPTGVDGDDASTNDWSDSRLRTRLAKLASAPLIDDQGGELALRFGATASGVVLLYDSNGACCYRGGITSSRGHRGPSLARRTLRSILEGTVATGRAPVFGCALHGPEDQCCAPNTSDTPDQWSSK